MAIEFHTLRVSKIRRETADAVSVSFEIPAHLKESFQFTPGQYLTIRAQLNGSDPRRSYSLCSSPLEDGDPTVTVKRVENGLVSSYLNSSVAVGDTLDVMPPLGNFKVEVQPYNAKHYVLIGGGSGITPLMSILKSVLLGEANSTVSLVYANRNKDSIIFHESLESLKECYGERLNIVYSLDEADAGWQGLQGLLTRERIGNLLTSTLGQEQVKNCFYYVCGPTGLMDAAQSALDDLHVAKERVFREYFTLPVNDGNTDSSPSESEAADGEFSEADVTVVLYGMETHIKVKPGETILDVAVREEIDPPFACQIGACCTCRAKVLSGKVEMDEREALTDEEIEEGYILTCQAHPLTEKVIVDYDQ